MIINGNALNIPLAGGTVQTCVTSPPYFGLRDYGVDGQSYTGDGCALDRQIAMHVGRCRLRVAVLSRDSVIQNSRSERR